VYIVIYVCGSQSSKAACGLIHCARPTPAAKERIEIGACTCLPEARAKIWANHVTRVGRVRRGALRCAIAHIPRYVTARSGRRNLEVSWAGSGPGLLGSDRLRFGQAQALDDSGPGLARVD
jgi:hypothetical protein